MYENVTEGLCVMAKYQTQYKWTLWGDQWNILWMELDGIALQLFKEWGTFVHVPMA